MTVAFQSVKPLLLTTLVALLSAGCITRSLCKSNRRYADPVREFKDGGTHRGTYLGLQYRSGSLSEIYQFDSPFRNNGDTRFEVVIPVYGATKEEPLQAYESQRRRVGREPAELWIWWNDNMPGKARVTKDTNCRRIDLQWQNGRLAAVRRFVPDASFRTVPGNRAHIRIPWRIRSRWTYTARSAAYVGTVPADVVAGAGAAVGTVAVFAGILALEYPVEALVLVKLLD